MKYNIEVIEKGTGEVIEFMFQVEAKVMNKLRMAYAYDPFYTVRITN